MADEENASANPVAALDIDFSAFERAAALLKRDEHLDDDGPPSAGATKKGRSAASRPRPPRGWSGWSLQPWLQGWSRGVVAPEGGARGAAARSSGARGATKRT